MPETQSSPQIRFVTTADGTELATRTVGEPLRGTVLLVMGATASMVWWPDSMVRALSQSGFRVICFDHRDTGQSTTNPPGEVRYDIMDLASDLIAILDAHDVESAHLVGMSLGGYLAQIAALTHPQRVKSLTLVASEPLGIDYAGAGLAPAFMDHFASMAELDWTNHDAVARFLLRIAELSAGSALPFDTDAALARIETELARTQSMQSAFNHSMLAGQLDAGLDAGKLDLPVLLIHGTEDPIIAVAAAEASAAATRDAQVLLFAGRGHELLQTDIPSITDAIVALTKRDR